MTAPARPLVGITTYPAGTRGSVSLPHEYVDSVRRAGADVVLLPPGAGPEAVRGLLARLDGIVLAGGGDLAPERWGGGPHPWIYSLDPERDADELAMVHVLLETGLPTLAICRGSQVLNVALGGTLHPHLLDLAGPDSVTHRVEPPSQAEIASPTPHPVTVEAGSLVAEAMGATEVVPMSWHHQAVDRLGEGLTVVGRAADGIVEAIAHDSHPYLLAVQWHPELTADTDPTQQGLFDALVAHT